MPIAVVAIGGNSLVRPGRPNSMEEQRRNLLATCDGIAAVLKEGYHVVVTHGNGPQVGDAWRRAEMASGEVAPLPLDACVAETQGTIGYLMEQVLRETLHRHGLSCPVATMVTQVLVSSRDPAFQAPTKPVGRFYTRHEAEHCRTEFGWHMVEDAHRGYRRVVPSPQPQEIIELPAIKAALSDGALVIACGGGGIPVVFRHEELVGVEAVIDKDRVSSLLAWELEADLFLISTAVERVSLHFGTPQQQPVEQLSAKAARRYLAEGEFPPGSMGPKIEAALEYLERGGKLVIITSPECIPDALYGLAGTRLSLYPQAANLHSLRPAA
ncbi:MAG TPA: carbamate kinase [Terriglobia bacterium]|nr:carbamate kinase [Terriglobia bacterium]